jgi:hypothetical protein
MSPQSTLTLIKVLFAGIGLAMLAGALAMVISTRDFIARAASADGEVIDLRGSKTLAPVVRFTDADGRTREFVSSVSSSPPSYDIGEKVVVLYDRGAPQDAKIKGWSDLWFGPTILGGMGSVFASIGIGMWLAGRMRARKEFDLRHNGRVVQAAFRRVEQNTSLAVNNRHPWRLVCQWQDPATGQEHEFLSDNLWYDPTDFILAETLDVFVDKRNPKRYCVDLSFLPEAAG